MNLSREFKNGFIIAVCIGAYFLLLEFLGLADQHLLRVVNLFIVVFGINLTLKANFADHQMGYFKNLKSGFITAMIGAVMGVIGLLIYIPLRGGEAYLTNLSKGFLFGGGATSIPTYCISLLFESAAGNAIICFCLMQYWKTKFTTIA
jgi:hypothetical protein